MKLQTVLLVGLLCSSEASSSSFSYTSMIPCVSSSSRVASTMGHIMAAAAVLLIHIETNVVTATSPKFSFLGLHPTNIIVHRATLRCKLQCSTAMAMTSPPTNIMFVSLR